jgi:hypothetical protein
MKSILTFAAAAIFSVSGMLAQSNPQIGTWNLNLAKSKFAGVPAPKSQTTTAEASGTGVHSKTTKVAADGTSTSYEWTVLSFDGKEYPLTGSGAPGDTIAVKRNGNTFESTMKKAGKVVQSNKVVYSKDGKLRTVTITLPGQTTSSVMVYDRQ